MKELILVGKAFALTIVAILAMQIKVGNETIEQKSEAWIKHSSFVGKLQEVADGALVVVNKGLDKLDEVLSARNEDTGSVASSDDSPGRRHMSMRLERSKAFLKEQADKVKSVAKKSVNAVKDEYWEDTEGLTEEFAEESVAE